MNFEWSAVTSALPELLRGLRLTIFISIIGLCGGLVVGTLAGMARTYSHGLLSALAQGYIGLIRGTPIVVQVMFIYFALPIIAGIRMDGVTAAILTIIINSGAYIAEIVRGALQAVPPGLSEAGLSMGLPFSRVLAYIVGPLAFRLAIPPLGNQIIASVKDTSLFLVIGVGELTRQGQEIMAENFRAVEIWSAVAVIYLLVVSVIAVALRLLERSLRFP